MQSGLADHVKWQIAKTEYELYIPLSDLSLSGSVGKFSFSEIMKLSIQLVNKQFAYTGKLY